MASFRSAYFVKVVDVISIIASLRYLFALTQRVSGTSHLNQGRIAHSNVQHRVLRWEFVPSIPMSS
jgi:hypothetical protein